MTFAARRIRQTVNKILCSKRQPNQAIYLLAGQIHCRRTSLFPGIISANVPEVALGVATAKAPPAIVLVFDLDDDLGAKQQRRCDRSNRRRRRPGTDSAWSRQARPEWIALG